MTNVQKQIGCLDKADYGNAHQLQLWMDQAGGQWVWALHNAYVPGGKLVRRCELESGSNPDYAEARRLGQERFDLKLKQELEKIALANLRAGAETETR